MKSLSILFLSLIIISFSCSDNKVNPELEKPPLYGQLDFSPEQIKYWYINAKDWDRGYSLIEETDSSLKYEMVINDRVYQFQNNKCIRIVEIRPALNNDMSQHIIKTMFQDLKESGFKVDKLYGNDFTVLDHLSIPNVKAMYSQQMNENRTNLIHMLMYYKD